MAADQQASPDEGTHLAERDAKLVDARWICGLLMGMVHSVSVPEDTLPCYATPRNLALSHSHQQP